MKQLQKKLRRCQKKIVDLKEEQAKQHSYEEDAAKQALQLQKTKGGKQLSLQGAFALAIRRNFSNCATADIGAVLLEDISRYTVTRAEGRAGAALVASSRLFHNMLYEDLVYNDGSFHIAVHSYRQDATNSGILRGGKLAALILRSAFLKENGQDAEDGRGEPPSWSSDEWTLDSSFDHCIRVADILPVKESDSSTTVAQTLKQLQSLGCLTWKDVQSRPELQKFPGQQLSEFVGSMFC